MKKVFSAILLLVLLFMLSACGPSVINSTVTDEPQEYTSQGTPIIHDGNLDSVDFISTPDSTAFCQIGYDSANHILVVEFRESGLYRYLDVPPFVWSALRSADSKGGYYNEHIKGQYDCEKIN